MIDTSFDPPQFLSDYIFNYKSCQAHLRVRPRWAPGVNRDLYFPTLVCPLQQLPPSLYKTSILNSACTTLLCLLPYCATGEKLIFCSTLNRINVKLALNVLLLPRSRVCLLCLNDIKKKNFKQVSDEEIFFSNFKIFCSVAMLSSIFVFAYTCVNQKTLCCCCMEISAWTHSDDT